MHPSEVHECIEIFKYAIRDTTAKRVCITTFVIIASHLSGKIFTMYLSKINSVRKIIFPIGKSIFLQEI